MRTRSSQKKRINVVTLGCSKNIYDSEVLMGQLKASGKDVVHEEEGEVVVINTCGFIDNAKQESIDTILHFAELKKAGKVEKVYVTGCLSERYKPELEAEIPEIDSWFGTRDLPRLLKTLGADYKQELVGQRLLTTPSHYAYLKISEGCDRPCSFCAIPLMRGSHRSTPLEDLVEQTRALASKGVKELMLIAQDLTYYGLDLYGKRELARLLRAMAEVDGIDWIRLHYLFPTGFPEDILEVVREEPKLCRYADIPLQHISDAVLKSMRRGTTQAKTEALIEKMRNQVPGIALRTTLIVGYPGETDRDFQTLYDWVERSRFDRLGVFTYSHEENTHAYTLTDDVPEEVKRERLEAIMDLQRGISWELNQVRVGQELKVLIDRAETGVFIGRTEFDSPDVDNEVHIAPPANTHLRIGDFVRARIVEAEEYDLKGELVD